MLQGCEKDVCADGILQAVATIDGGIQNEVHDDSNVSLPLKRPIHADSEAITTDVEKKKFLKVVKKEKI